MEAADALVVPTARDDEARGKPVMHNLADVIGALARAEPLFSPTRLETAVSVAEVIGRELGEPSLMQVLALRALAAPKDPMAAIAGVKVNAGSLTASERALVLRELLRLLGDSDRPRVMQLATELARALSVALPDSMRAAGQGSGFRTMAQRAMQAFRTESRTLSAAREFASEFQMANLSQAIVEARQSGELSQVAQVLPACLATVRADIAEIMQAAEARAAEQSLAQELETAANQLERVAQQRFAAITRRAKMLKRHIREDLDALAEDAAEEFEADFRRLAESKKGLFGKIDTSDLNNRVVVKNVERRYRNLASRYQDHLDLLDREVSEFADEFTRACDDVLRPVARHEFRAIVPHPSLELRMKQAADRASSRALVAGAAGAVASGAAVHSGLLAAGAVLGAAVTPAGAVVLGAVALAGVWSMFTNPGERRRRDLRDRARSLEENLRNEIKANLPRFDEAVDAVVARFQSVIVPDIARPRIEAERIREIARDYRVIADEVATAAQGRLDRFVATMRGGGLLTSDAD